MSVRIELTSGKMAEINWKYLRLYATLCFHSLWNEKHRLSNMTVNKHDFMKEFDCWLVGIRPTTSRNKYIHMQLQGVIVKHLHLKSAHTGVCIYVALVMSPRGCVGVFKQGLHLPNWPIFYIAVIVRGRNFQVKISNFQSSRNQLLTKKKKKKKWLTVTTSQALPTQTQVFLKTLLSPWPFIQT